MTFTSNLRKESFREYLKGVRTACPEHKTSFLQVEKFYKTRTYGVNLEHARTDIMRARLNWLEFKYMNSNSRERDNLNETLHKMNIFNIGIMIIKQVC